MKNVLIEASSIELDNIEEMRYDEATNEILIKTKDKKHTYRVEETFETYIVRYETPLYINNLAREAKK